MLMDMSTDAGIAAHIAAVAARIIGKEGIIIMHTFVWK
jgi:hypothetical protein